MADVVPVVLFGRYATFSGEGAFTTEPVNVVAYESMELAVWRGLMPANTSFEFRVETSMDRETWQTVAARDPGPNQESVLTVSLTDGWLRGRVLLTNAGTEWPVVTCYAVGYLQRRK